MNLISKIQKKINRLDKKPSLQIDAAKESILDGMTKRQNKAELVEILNAEHQVSQLPYWVGRLPIMHLPVEMLVMPGAHHYASDYHPFVSLLKTGRRDYFDSFYQSFCPVSLADMYGVSIEDNVLGADLKPYDEPWFLRESKIPSGENGLSAKHGASFYGPVSPQKLELEYQRVTQTYESISMQGYLPHKFGHIDGFFLQYQGQYKFYVNGAKHRAAALAALGYSHIPVMMRDNMTRIVSDKDVAGWPLVAAGKISQDFALSVLKAYFEPSDPLKRMTSDVAKNHEY
ncbi:hypothetical protein [Thiomicrospira sp. ALE5]|uniref:hypothetical protein n=1 Tax=Thiomicrospira sp. ALE5 TaxID=748650 RepID=UPI0008EDE758|nr:hypothetical protein [Thiomicrospira sp. ALE5]SFR49115.1 hypothetical protein SAMN03092900_0095 [Thiomicrospira sp. ALE5]